MEFINENLIDELIEHGSNSKAEEQLEIIEKAKSAKGISIDEAAMLLSIDNEEVLDKLFKAAKEIKERIYGNRLVLFAPLYLTNACVNNCLYCAFRRDNKELNRKTLALEEIKLEAEILIKQGHKRLLLVCGEHPKLSNLDFVEDAVKSIYDINYNGNNIRRININIAPLSLNGFKRLKSFEIGTYQIFQETYHYDTYKIMHPSGPKRDFAWRLYAPDRAFQAGIDDLGIGALFGLTDYKFETLALLMHAEYLEKTYGVGPHTISIPRLEPAMNAPAAEQPPYAVDDLSFKIIVAVLRLAVPYTGIILSTRERAELRRNLFSLGVSQISAGSRTSPGSYANNGATKTEMQQFQLGDHRSLDEVVQDCCKLGFLPSFCTACYRSNRTGDRFMKLAKSGNIGKICDPNALATFEEYLLDYASENTRFLGNKVIENMLDNLDVNLKNKTEEMIFKLRNGERDVYF